MDLKEKTIASFKKYVSGDEFSQLKLPVIPKASVLIPLLVRDGQLRLLLTVRSIHVRNLMCGFSEALLLNPLSQNVTQNVFLA